MKLLWLLAFFVCLASFSELNAQLVLNGTLETDSKKAVANTRVNIVGGQGDITDSRGRFRIILSRDFKEGERIIFNVDKPGWIINYPLDGEWNLPNVRLQTIQPLTVILVPRGSKALWTHARIEKLIAKLSGEIAQLKKEGNTPTAIDFSFYLSEWAGQYGFTPDQVKEQFDRWAQGVRTSSDYRTVGLREFYRSNFVIAAENFEKAATKDEEKSKRLQEQSYKAIISAADNWKLSGNALLSSYKFREAMRNYARAQTLLSKQRQPDEWRELEVLIAIAKRELGVRIDPSDGRILFEEAENSLRQVLRSVSVEQNTQQWMTIKLNLGNTLYSKGMEASGSEGTRLLNEAASEYREILKVFTIDKFPEQWARVENNLTNVLRKLASRVEGDESARLFAESVEGIKKVLGIYTRQRFPIEWAGAQNSLGNALSDQAGVLPPDAKAKLLGESAIAYRNALEIYTFERHPEDWAKVSLNLGGVLQQRAAILRGDVGTQLVAEARDVIRSTLKVYTYEQVPQEWARTHIALGAALGTWATLTGGPEGMRSIEEAISEFREALKVYTFKDLPQDWAETMKNIAVSQLNESVLTEGDARTELVAKAIETLKETLKVFSRVERAQDWASIQFLLARAYEDLKDWNDALGAYGNVLSVNPNFYRAYVRSAHIYQDLLHDYEKAFALNKQWVEKHPDYLPLLTDFAEKHFTTGRFVEAQTRSANLINHPGVRPGTRVALRFVEIASLVALGKKDAAGPLFERLIDDISKQPKDFTLGWDWEGTIYYIEKNENLASNKEWLIQMIHALQSADRDAILAALKPLKLNAKGRLLFTVPYAYLRLVTEQRRNSPEAEAVSSASFNWYRDTFLSFSLSRFFLFSVLQRTRPDRFECLQA